ncbi:cytochrome c-type biogenesis protein [Granulicella arctica]|uniref:Cytochrome c-type biogenesis protein n=1 Tax=Granulicella arctica TaxID=940613 RepID=A0A7Y9PJ10_9BACT|nr:cytochrome c-type biogenesis protein CcmH [Granulicella arctica]NYF80732.1 cytochrome c-type biogenesis protein CcmH [Granulicella arctica]
MRKLLRSRWAHAAIVCCIMVVMLGAGDPLSRFNKLGHEMICTCSCGQILLECNHVGCPVSEPMIGELRAQLASGGTDTSILNWFAAKYGAIVLAAPIRGGFDNVAWIAPIAVFFLATIGTAVIVRVWKLRTVQGATIKPAVPGNPAADALRERIRRETEY